MVNEFTVYNGPVGRDLHDGAPIYPYCKVDNCKEQICPWMSDRLCFEHATRSVMEFDKANQVGQK